jgi:hypothetical protein
MTNGINVLQQDSILRYKHTEKSAPQDNQKQIKEWTQSYPIKLKKTLANSQMIFLCLFIMAKRL